MQTKDTPNRIAYWKTFYAIQECLLLSIDNYSKDSVKEATEKAHTLATKIDSYYEEV